MNGSADNFHGCPMKTCKIRKETAHAAGSSHDQDVLPLKLVCVIMDWMLLSLHAEIENRFEYWKCKPWLQPQCRCGILHLSEDDLFSFWVAGRDASCPLYSS